jgi:cyclopropane-fatty-acyl-phospholipid synthase
MSKSEDVIRSLLELAEVQVNGSKPWDIQVHDKQLYARLLRNPFLGLGESYMDGYWDCEALDEMVCRMLRARLQDKIKGDWTIMARLIGARLTNLQRTGRAFQVGELHYDLGNELYKAMLDSRMNYTCGYWKNASDLDSAQEAKLELICRKIGLKPGMSVLELGCGFGAFARYAAERYGVEVTGLTISRQQLALGTELCQGLPVQLHLQDYRLATGSYDRVISIGIMEHVGYRNYREYMQLTDRCLKPGGIAFFHTIGANQSSTHCNAWTNKYIFPNGMIPSIAQLGAAMEGLFVMEDWQNFGPDYDKTLMAWYDNFNNSWYRLKGQYDQRFYRMWRYYLLSCAGGFRARVHQLWQVVLTRPGSPQPDCRLS